MASGRRVEQEYFFKADENIPVPLTCTRIFAVDSGCLERTV